MAHILVIDDEITIREPLRAFLETLGYQTDECADGCEALLALSKRDYDIVLSDVMMPNMNGFQFLERALPYIGERTPIIILSSMADDEGVQAAIMSGAFDYLLKPCDPSRAEGVLTAAMKQREAWLARMGPYRSSAPVVPPDVLDLHPVEVDRVPKNVPLSGQGALRKKPGIMSVASPESARDGARAPGGSSGGGLFGRLKALFRGKREVA